MNILVTGGSGFIGSRVVRQLTAWPGIEAAVLVRERSDLWRWPACGISATANGPRLVYADLADGSQIGDVVRRVRPEVIIHLAMAYHPLGSEGGAAVHAINREGTVRLLEAFLAAGGRRFVAAGTCFEYGHQTSAQVEETAPCCPLYDYALAKYQATEAILALGQARNAETLVLRVFAPYGPLEDVKRIVPQLLRAGLGAGRLALTEGEQVRDYVFVEDVARAFVAAALHPCLPRPQAVYNVCTGQGHSLRQLAAVVERVLGQPLELDWDKVPYRPNEMMRLVGANRRIAADLGWTPACPLEEGLRRTVAWLRTNPRAA